MGENVFIRILRFLLLVLTILVSFLSICALISSKHGGILQFFGFYGLLQPILMVLNLFFVLYWSFRKKIMALLPLLSIVLNIDYIGAVYQPTFRKIKTPESSTEVITVATYNAAGFYHGERALTVKMVSDFMSQQQVDILCLQEMDYDSIFTVDSIGKAFPGLHYYTTAYSKKIGFHLMVLSKYPILTSLRFQFEETGNQAMQTDLLIHGDTIRIFNYHLQTTNFRQTNYKMNPGNLIWNLSSEAEKSMSVYQVLTRNYEKRSKQADFIQKQISQSRIPTIVCGDMNSNPSAYTYHQLRGELRDGFKTCGKGYEYTILGLYRLYRIDYIFHSEAFSGYSYQSYQLDFSDHKPVIMKLGLNK